MAGTQDRREVVVPNAQGLHARPADLLARTATRFQADIWFVKDGDRFDAKSILSIMTMGAAQGTSIEIVAQGEDAVEAVAAIADWFERGFDESSDDACSGREHDEALPEQSAADDAPSQQDTT